MTEHSRPRRIAILGAGGRDFHNFNMVFRDNPEVRVVAFGAAQIPRIAGRRYPPTLAGPLYPDGLEILPEDEILAMARRGEVDEIVFAYSDVAHVDVMHLASAAIAAGADFSFLGPERTMLRADLPVIAVSAVRTGCGKSPVSRFIARCLRENDLRPAVLRHPMPYGDLAAQAAQRFATVEDLAAAHCTIEEREEYEPYIRAGGVIFAGVDYARILEAAATEADIVLWDGGNNDFPFIRPDLHIVLTDALRPGHETFYHPGEAVLRMADQVLIMKVTGAEEGAVAEIEENVAALVPEAGVLHGDLAVTLTDEMDLSGKRVIVVEDGPTITHGGMATGAGFVAALAAGAEVVDPRPMAHAEIAKAYARYPHIGPVLPALGYYAEQLEGLAATIAAADADAVVIATPIALETLIEIEKPALHARYAYQDCDPGGLKAVIDGFCRSLDAGAQ